MNENENIWNNNFVSAITKSSALENNIDMALINVGVPDKALQIPHQQPIDSSNDGTKAYCCDFCKKIIEGKITDHWFSVHKEKFQIKEILALPPALTIRGHHLTDSQQLREKLFAKLAKEGNVRKIMNASLSDKCTTMRTNGKNKTSKKLSDYRLRYGFYMKTSIRNHISQFVGIPKSKKLSDYRQCSGCHGFYLKTSMRKHISQFIGIPSYCRHHTLAIP